MALTKIDAERAKRAVNKNIERVKAGKKPLRAGQRARVRKKKARVLRDVIEATDVQARADKIIAYDGWRLGGLSDVKTLYLFTHAEKVGGGCMDDTVKMQRYPRLMRWKTGLKFEFLCVVPKPRWDRMTDEEKTQATFHALRHVKKDTDGRLGIWPHDHEGFYAEVEFFGVRSPEVKKIAEQLEFLGLLTKNAVAAAKETRV
jgi:hypothetical protein